MQTDADPHKRKLNIKKKTENVKKIKYKKSNDYRKTFKKN